MAHQVVAFVEDDQADAEIAEACEGGGGGAVERGERVAAEGEHVADLLAVG